MGDDMIDNETRDIVTEYVGGALTVRKLYDQSGNGFDFEQPAPERRPILSAG